MKINEKVQQLIKDKNMSNLEVSKLSGIPNSTLADILKGKTNKVSMEVVISLAKVLGVSVNYLMIDDIVDASYQIMLGDSLTLPAKVL